MNGEEGDDYAVLAAKEWLAGKLAYAEREAARSHGTGNIPCDYCAGQVNAIKAEIGQLAAVIRKQVAEHIDDINGSLMRQ